MSKNKEHPMDKEWDIIIQFAHDYGGYKPASDLVPFEAYRRIAIEGMIYGKKDQETD